MAGKTIAKLKCIRRGKHAGVRILSRQSMTFWHLSDNHRELTYGAFEDMGYLISTRYAPAKHLKGAAKVGLLIQVEDDVERYSIGYEGGYSNRWVEGQRYKQYMLTAFGHRLVKNRFRHREPKPWQEVWNIEAWVNRKARLKNEHEQ